MNERLQQFFSDLHGQISVVRNNRTFRNRFLADEFNLITFLRPDEYRLSELVKLLLDPRGGHGQQATFLEAFLRMAKGLRVAEPMLYKLRTGSQVTVRQEEPTLARRRVDIVISFGTALGLGIENKPWASDGDAQLSDYADWLRKTYKFWGLLYVSGSGESPSDKSLPRCAREQLLSDGSYSEWAYGGNLVAWLEECTRLCEAEKMRWLLRDFRSYLSQSVFSSIVRAEGERNA